MILDNHLRLSDEQVVSAIAPGSFASTNYIDQGAAGDANDELYFHCIVDTALSSAAGTGTFKVAIRTDSDSAFGSPTTLFTSEAVTVPQVAGKTIAKLRLPKNCERYIQAYYTVGTDTLSAGKVDCFLAKESNHGIDVTP